MAVSLEIPNKRYRSQGKCIFCLTSFDADADPPILPTVEHIIPEAICKTGQMVIEDGSCKSCNNGANQRFESLCINTTFNVVRVLLDLRRKRRNGANRRPIQLPRVASGDLVMSSDEELFDVNLSPEEFPNLVQLPYFPLPAGKLLNVERGATLELIQYCFFYIGPKPKQATNITIRQKFDNTALALTLAKIAYCYAVAERGIEGFDGTEIRDLLSGRRDDTYNFVGGLFETQYLSSRRLHQLYLKDRGGFLSVIVHLFASCKMNAHEVVVGRLATSAYA